MVDAGKWEKTIPITTIQPDNDNALILSVPHALSCIALAFASIYWKRKRSTENKTYRFLFPYVLAAGILGVTRILFPIMALVEAGIEHGANDVYSYYLDGPQAGLFLLWILLPLLPVLGMVPAIGRKPLLVGSLALLAMIPSAFVIFSELIRNP
jgi:hypothetical protein